MNPRNAAALSALLCAGCIFGGGEAPQTADASFDQSASSDATGAADAEADAGEAADAVSRDQGDPFDAPSFDAGSDADTAPQFLTLTPSPVQCPSGRVSSLVSAEDIGAPEGMNPVAAAAGFPPQAPEYENTHAYSLAWVTSGTDSVGIRVATVQPGTTDVPIVTLQGGIGVPLAVVGEVFQVLIGGREGVVDGNGEIPLYDVTLLTSEGVFSCPFGATETEPTVVQGSCAAFSAANNAAAVAQVTPPSSVATLPYFPGNRFVDSPLWIAAHTFWVAKGGANQDRIGAFYNEFFQVGAVALEEVQTSLLDYDPHAALVPGVDTRSNGFPYITMLARGVDDELRPTVMAENEGAYFPVDEPWRLPPGFRADQSFAFASGASAYVESKGSAGIWFATEYTLDPARGQARFGYATVTDEGGLVLGRSGGFTADADFARLELATPAREVYSAQNLVVGEAGQSGERAFGRPLLMVVSGPNRERLSLMRWDVGLEVGFAGDVMAGTSLLFIQDVRPTLLLVNGKGLVTFRAVRDEPRDGAGREFVFGTIPIDLSGSITACR